MISGIKNKILNRDFGINTVIVAGTAAIGARFGIQINEGNKIEMDTKLTREFGKYLNKIKENQENIKDTFELAKKNQEARDEFNALCDKSYNVILKNTSRRNILVGILCGIAVGIAGVMLKNKIFNKGKKNADIPDKKQLDVQS